MITEAEQRDRCRRTSLTSRVNSYEVASRRKRSPAPPVIVISGRLRRSSSGISLLHDHGRITLAAPPLTSTRTPSPSPIGICIDRSSSNGLRFLYARVIHTVRGSPRWRTRTGLLTPLSLLPSFFPHLFPLGLGEPSS